ncbi:MAG: hypothetical protein NUW22_12375 [Acidobacteria bacterium]|nr:hypothetical protein [Acidobacteriota bacterium]
MRAWAFAHSAENWSGGTSHHEVVAAGAWGFFGSLTLTSSGTGWRPEFLVSLPLGGIYLALSIAARDTAGK